MFFFTKLSSRIIPYKVTEGSWEDDDGFEDTWAICSSSIVPCDDCIDLGKILDGNGLKSLEK